MNKTTSINALLISSAILWIGAIISSAILDAHFTLTLIILPSLMTTSFVCIVASSKKVSLQINTDQTH